ncbi:HAD family hydrolase [Radiobacillus kanasensis]|uniref:HAD family hydrolase n=1 Tax=Radiobacillus kanasensis TaxID=2844358 RepID=UPI001E327568|nr:HAD family hydrolase [Radiobacillus kanasensis]UFU00679.1 HAD family hydrolase [Radiobacillus kanasensis]
MNKAILFDLDGTLLDREKSVRHFVDDQFNRLKPSFGHVRKSAYVHSFLKLDDRGYVWKDKVYQQMVEEFDITMITWQELLEDYVTNFYKSCIPFPNLIETLDQLACYGYKMGIITNGKDPFQMNNIRALHIENYLDTILISEKEKLKKPDPLLFQRGLKQLGVQASEAFFVGDHPKNDIEAAHKVGMQTIWKRTDYENVPKADFIIDDLHEILDIITGP